MKKTLFIICVTLLPMALSGQGKSLSLDECKNLAFENNIGLKNTRLDRMSAMMKKEEAFSNWFPVISAKAMAFKALDPLLQVGLSDVLGSSDMANNLKYYLETEAGMYGVNTQFNALGQGYGAGLYLTQPIYAGGRIVNGNRLASLGIEASELQEGIAKRDLEYSVEGKYRLAVSLEEKKKALDEALALSDKLLGEAESAVSSGLTNDGQLDEILLKRQELKSNEVRLKGSIMLAKMDLCNAIGLDSAEAMNLDLSESCLAFGEPSTYYRDPSETVSGMNESALLELGVEQKKLEKSMALGEALPQVGIGASYGYGKTIGPARTNGAVYASVSIPITDWKKTSSRMKDSEYQMQKAQNSREHLLSMLELQLRQQWVEVESCWEEIAVKEESLTLALKREERAKADYAAGLVTGSEYIQRQVESSFAECDLIDARIAYGNAVSAFCLGVVPGNSAAL